MKALAEETSRATAEITGHIGVVQSTTDQAANAILGIGKTIDEINHIASTIAAAVEEQGSATEDIARNVDQAAQGTTEVTRNITGVNHAAEAASASTNQVLSFATELAKQSEKLRGEIHKFLIRVRAAKQAESPDGWASTMATTPGTLLKTRQSHGLSGPAFANRFPMLFCWEFPSAQHTDHVGKPRTSNSRAIIER